MGLENRTLNNIDVKFAQADKTKPNCWFEYGTLWADTDSKEDVDMIKEAVEEMVNDNYEVRVSKLNATDREPWDQYAFDIVDKIRG